MPQPRGPSESEFKLTMLGFALASALAFVAVPAAVWVLFAAPPRREVRDTRDVPDADLDRRFEEATAALERLERARAKERGQDPEKAVHDLRERRARERQEEVERRVRDLERNH